MRVITHPSCPLLVSTRNHTLPHPTQCPPSAQLSPLAAHDPLSSPGPKLSSPPHHHTHAPNGVSSRHPHRAREPRLAQTRVGVVHRSPSPHLPGARVHIPSSAVHGRPPSSACRVPRTGPHQLSCTCTQNERVHWFANTFGASCGHARVARSRSPRECRTTPVVLSISGRRDASRACGWIAAVPSSHHTASV